VKAARYDTIWLEHGGTKADSGFFVMSSIMRRRPDEDIPSRKRALYRRRYEFMDMLGKNIGHEFSLEYPTIKRHLIAYSDI
jgi:uncharacterized protein VirK/YbjX